MRAIQRVSSAENRCLFLNMLRVFGGSARQIWLKVFFLWRFFFPPPLQGLYCCKWIFAFSVYVDFPHPPNSTHTHTHTRNHLPADSFWPHVNYFVNPHISFNCCGFVYPGDQIELGEAVGDCQHGSVRKRHECRSNSLTTGARVRHADSVRGLMDVWMAWSCPCTWYSGIEMGFGSSFMHGEMTTAHQARPLSALYYI